MIMRLFALLSCIWTALAFALPPAAMALPATQRIVAIGDLHGDYEAWRAIARSARLIDQRGHWAGGRTILVQNGDVVDRGPDSRKINDDLMRLQREARRAGGQVVALIGNHEAMTMTGDLRYVHPGEFSAYATGGSARLREAVYRSQQASIEAAARAKDPGLPSATIRAAWMAQVPLGYIERQRAWLPSGRLGRWVVSHPAVVRIGDTLFVHGGISSDYTNVSIDEINRRVAQALSARTTAEDSIINDPRGPLWYRGLVTRQGLEERSSTPDPAATSRIGPPPRPSIEQELDRVLAAFKVRRIVIAHTPNLQGIVISHDGKLVRIDTGISRTYGGVLSWLEIVGERVVPHMVARPPSSSAVGK
jgi:hypothetical protein